MIGILYDDAFRPIASHRTGSLRSNTTSPELVQANIRDMIDTLGLHDRTIGRISGIACDVLVKEVCKTCQVGQVDACGEYEAGMHAAEIFEDGILALSGTGATMFCGYQGKLYVTGGYGSAVSDTGSGYWIGREALNAAIEDDENRGPETLLTPLIAEHFGCDRENFRSAVFRIYSNTVQSPSACVASCVPLVTRAAEQGDDIARQILRRAGRKIGEQVISMVSRNKLPKNLPITISGSVWRGHPLLFSSFQHVLEKAGMEQEVRVPAYEPIIGILIRDYMRLHGSFGPDEHARFLSWYPEYAFMVSSDLYQKNRPIPTYLL